MRDRGTIRHHRERVIENRVRMIRAVARMDPWRSPGHFAKVKPWNCSCPMCQSPTKATGKGKERQRIKAELRGGDE